MKNRHALFAAAALAALAFGLSPAYAQDIVVDANLVSLSQAQSGVVDQAGLAADIAVGHVNNSSLSSGVTNALNVADVTNGVTSLALSGDGGAGNAVDVAQSVGNTVTQVGASVTGSGGLTNSSSLASVTNAANVGSINTSVNVNH